MNLDDLELELRRVPGVRSVGFAEQDGVLLVQVQVVDGGTHGDPASESTRLVTRLADRPVTVEVVRWRGQPAGLDALLPGSGAGPVGGWVGAGGGPASPDAGAGEPRGGEDRWAGEEGGLRDQAAAGGGRRDEAAGAGGAERPDESAAGEGAERPDESAAGEGAERPDEAAGGEAAGGPGGEPWATGAGHGEPTHGGGPGPGDGGGPGGEGATAADGPDATVGRIRLLATMSVPDSGEIEVHLGLGGRRTIGRAPAGRGLVGAVEATVGALRPLVGDLGFEPAWATTIDGRDDPTLVAVGLRGSGGEGARYGVARSASGLEAAAKATLHALNRTVVRRAAATA